MPFQEKHPLKNLLNLAKPSGKPVGQVLFLVFVARTQTCLCVQRFTSVLKPTQLNLFFEPIDKLSIGPLFTLHTTLSNFLLIFHGLGPCPKIKRNFIKIAGPKDWTQLCMDLNYKKQASTGIYYLRPYHIHLHVTIMPILLRYYQCCGDMLL